MLHKNKALRFLACGLSTISTATMVATVASPTKAHIYAPIAFTTGVASSITSAMSDEIVRSRVNNSIKKASQNYSLFWR